MGNCTSSSKSKSGNDGGTTDSAVNSMAERYMNMSESELYEEVNKTLKAYSVLQQNTQKNQKRLNEMNNGVYFPNGSKDATETLIARNQAAMDVLQQKLDLLNAEYNRRKNAQTTTKRNITIKRNVRN